MKTMSPQGRKIWGSQQGQSLMKAMLSGSAKTAEHQKTLAQLKSSKTKAKKPPKVVPQVASPAEADEFNLAAQTPEELAAQAAEVKRVADEKNRVENNAVRRDKNAQDKKAINERG